jgi:hypothetical protein
MIIGLPDCFPHAFGWRIAGLRGRCSHVTRCCGRGEDKPNLCISGFDTKRQIKFGLAIVAFGVKRTCTVV